MNLPLAKDAPPDALTGPGGVLLLLRTGAEPRFAVPGDLDTRRSTYCRTSTQPSGALVPAAILRRLLARAKGAAVTLDSRMVTITRGTFRARLYAPKWVRWRVLPGHFTSCQLHAARHWPTVRCLELAATKLRTGAFSLYARIVEGLLTAERRNAPGNPSEGS